MESEMSNEHYTLDLCRREMKFEIGENEWGHVHPQGIVSEFESVTDLLRKAGGKPTVCRIEDYSQTQKGIARPEFIITLNDDPTTIIVIECKKSANLHASENLDKPNSYAVDGVLYYTKYLKEGFNVIAIAVSGTKKENLKVDAFYWAKGLTVFDKQIFKKSKDILLHPKNYIRMIKGEKIQKDYSLDQIREVAITMHNYLRDISVREEHKPIFIAGILIALNNADFANNYQNLNSFNMIMTSIQSAIESELYKSDIKDSRTDYIKGIFNILKGNTKFAQIPLSHEKSITWYIDQLDRKILPMMNYAESSLDALGVFYHEFIKYSGGDGKGLGIVLTPQHLTEFMVEVAEINKNSKVVDICCGSGSFLVSAMFKMFSGANPVEQEKIRAEGLYGIENDEGLYTLAITNMIIRKDGKSNIFKGDCFDKNIVDTLKTKNLTTGLINPPYSLKNGQTELEFVEQLLSILTVGGIGVAVVPMSCAIGTKFRETRERLFNKHTLKAVFSMADETFYPIGTNPCVMVWTAHVPHDCGKETFFGFFKNDGFVKRKKLGRIDYYNKWDDILKEWLKLYHNRDIIDGLTARACITHKDEWLAEAYMKTDYSTLTQSDFQKTINDYLAYLITSGDIDEN
jgi:type I restriction-modification system DNA methylase subunit